MQLCGGNANDEEDHPSFDARFRRRRRNGSARPCGAQTGLPDKSLKILVGFPAGGGTDVMARFLAEPLKQRTGRNVLIDNKAGASGTIAVETLKNAAPDGTTIAYVPSATIVQKLTMKSVPFDPLTDIQPITLAGTVQTAFCVSPTIGVNTLPEYIEWLKKNPTRQSFGTTAMGSFTHFFGVMAGREIGIPLEPVPYKGAAPLIADLQGGHIAAGCGGITDFLEHHRAGKVKVIFTSGTKPTTSAPEIPTATQLGYPKLQILGWYVFFAPAKTAGAAGRCLGHGAEGRPGAARSPEEADRSWAGRRDLDASRVHPAHDGRPRALEDDHRFDRL